MSCSSVIVIISNYFLSFLQGQYIFVHEALREYIRCGVTEIIAKELRDYTRKLQTQVPGSQELGVDREFNVSGVFTSCYHNLFGYIMYWNSHQGNKLKMMDQWWFDIHVVLTMIPCKLQLH